MHLMSNIARYIVSNSSKWLRSLPFPKESTHHAVDFRTTLNSTLFLLDKHDNPTMLSDNRTCLDGVEAVDISDPESNTNVFWSSLRAAPAYEALRESGVSVTHPHAAVQAEIRATYIESERELARQCLGESQLLRRLVEVESPTSIFALEEVVVMEKAVPIVTRFAIAGSDSGSDYSGGTAPF